MVGLFAMILVAISVLILGGLLSERITAVIRHRAPNFWLEGDGLILWGLVVLAAFVLGLIVMYLVLRP